MEKQVKLSEKSCSVLLKYFDCENLTKVMINKKLQPRIEDCLEVYRRLYMCKRSDNKLNILRKTIKV